VSAVSLVSITASDGRLEAIVRVTGPLRTSAYPGLSDRALSALPTLAAHTCDNADGRTPADELADTELPHALEHVALDLLHRAGVRGTLRGETTWDFERDGTGVFRVVLDGADAMPAEAAIESAARFMGWLTGDMARPEVAGQVARVRKARTAVRPEPQPRPRRQ